MGDITWQEAEAAAAADGLVAWGPYDVTDLTDDELAALEARLSDYYRLGA